MPVQMALDELFFQQAAAGKFTRPLFRIYFSSEPWVSAGYSDPGPFPEGEKICRRITGGGRVQHGRDVIFSLIARKEDDDTFKSVRTSYWKIHEAVKAALEWVGEKPRFYRCDEKLPRGGECFMYPIATDLALGNQKVAGGAQKRSMGVLLHQESVQLPKRLDAFEFAGALEKAFQQQFSIFFEDSLWDPEVLEAAKRLARGRQDFVTEKVCA